jgi:hypothetical protein
MSIRPTLYGPRGPQIGSRPEYKFHGATNNSYKENISKEAEDFRRALHNYHTSLENAPTAWNAVDVDLKTLNRLRKERDEYRTQGNNTSADSIQQHIAHIEKKTDKLAKKYKKQYLQSPSVFQPIFNLEPTFYQRTTPLLHAAERAEKKYLVAKADRNWQNAIRPSLPLNKQAKSHEAHNLLERLKKEREEKAAANTKAQGGSRKRSARSKRKSHRRKTHRR